MHCPTPCPPCNPCQPDNEQNRLRGQAMVHMDLAIRLAKCSGLCPQELFDLLTGCDDECED